MAKIPWEQIRQEYVQGVEQEGSRVYPSQRDLADKYGMDPATIGRKAKADNWSAQRDIFISKLTAESQQKTLDSLSDDASEFNLLTFQAAQAAVERIHNVLTDSNQRINTDDLAKLSSAMKNFQAVGRLALGQTTDEVGVKGKKLEDFIT